MSGKRASYTGSDRILNDIAARYGSAQRGLSANARRGKEAPTLPATLLESSRSPLVERLSLHFSLDQ